MSDVCAQAFLQYLDEQTDQYVRFSDAVEAIRKEAGPISDEDRVRLQNLVLQCAGRRLMSVSLCPRPTGP